MPHDYYHRRTIGSRENSYQRIFHKWKSLESWTHGQLRKVENCGSYGRMCVGNPCWHDTEKGLLNLPLASIHNSVFLCPGAPLGAVKSLPPSTTWRSSAKEQPAIFQ